MRSRGLADVNIKQPIGTRSVMVDEITDAERGQALVFQAMFLYDARAQALQGLPADRVDFEGHFRAQDVDCSQTAPVHAVDMRPAVEQELHNIQSGRVHRIDCLRCQMQRSLSFLVARARVPAAPD